MSSDQTIFTMEQVVVGIILLFTTYFIFEINKELLKDAKELKIAMISLKINKNKFRQNFLVMYLENCISEIQFRALFSYVVFITAVLYTFIYQHIGELELYFSNIFQFATTKYIIYLLHFLTGILIFIVIDFISHYIETYNNIPLYKALINSTTFKDFFVLSDIEDEDTHNFIIRNYNFWELYKDVATDDEKKELMRDIVSKLHP